MDFDLVLGLDAHDSAADGLSELGVVVVLVAAGFHDVFKVLVVLLVHLAERDAGGGLLVDDLSEASLALDEAVGHVLLLAEGGQEHHQLDRVHVVRDHHQLGLFVLDESGDVVEAELDHAEHLFLGALLVLDLVGGLALQTLLLLGLGLGAVLVEELEHLAGLVAVEGVLELVDGGRHLQALEQDALLALDPHVLRPRHEPRQVLARLDVAADAEVLWPGLHQRVHRFFVLTRLGRNNFPHRLLRLNNQSVPAQPPLLPTILSSFI